MSTAILPLAVWASGTNQNSTPANDNALRLEAINREIISQAVTAQPASPTDGDTYIIAATHTGAQWAGFSPKDIAIYRGGTWYAWAPVEGVIVNVAGTQYKYDGGVWASAGGGGGSVAGSDKQVQFNDGGAFGAEAGFEYDKTSNTLTVDKVYTAASTTSGAGLRAPHGAAPTSPTNGDVWTTTAGIFARINGVTVGPLSSGGSFTGGALTSALDEAKATDIASAGTANIGAATGNLVHITGTTTITAFGTVQAGTRRVVVFDGALLLTHNATSLILPTGANITTVAGDTATCISEGSGNWRVTSYQRKDGSSLAGGSGLTSFTEAVNTSTPNATVPVVSLAATNAASTVDVALLPKGSAGSLLAHIPDNTATGGNKRGSSAVDFQRTRSTAAQVASGQAAVIPGGERNTASGAQCFAMGDTCVASGNAATAMGMSHSVSGYAGAAIGGGNHAVTGNRSIALGGQYQGDKGLAGLTTFGHAGAIASAAAKRQGELYAWSANTLNATPTVLTQDGGAASATNQVVLANNSCIVIQGQVNVREGTTGDSKGWIFSAMVKRGANAAATAVVGTPTVTVVGADAGASAWALAITANTSTGCLSLGITGEASKTLNWTGSGMAVYTAA